ncbi:response regulator [Kitasatospora sp. NPDC091335]|uniref:response regulator n=1 Tax=Streptomycetaceae TaxID=2062 RepID=UPI001661CF32|nr:response regulator transcription factor [Streptomyces sp. CBMA156]MBD0670748.1 DNA-binding response regulator [Streptomyces sp. CBMA156]
MEDAVTEPVRVLVVDDQALLRGSFRMLIDAEPGLTVVGEAADGAAAVELAAEQRPDVVLMDVRMPGMDGIEATRAICEHSPDVRVLMLTMFDLDAHVFAALRAGAAGFLLKDIPPVELLRAIQVVATGESLLSPSVTRRLIAEFCRHPATDPPGPPPALDGLTGRERQVLELVGAGRSNAEIARELYVSMATVKTHLGHLLDKLDARDRVQLVIIGYESGLLTPRQRA